MNGYTGTSDTYLDQFFPAFKAGLDPFFATSVDTGKLNAIHSLIRFDGITGSTTGLIPVGTKISGAALELNGFDAGDVVVHEFLQSWNELTESWSGSFGANGIQANGSEAATKGSPFFVGLGANSLTSATMLSTVQGWINGGPNNGWALLPGSTDVTQVFSSDNLFNRPRLNVTLDVSATLDIIDTDTATVKVIGSNTASEPATKGALVVGLSSKASSDVVIFYDDLLTGTAISGSDYKVIPSGSVTILAGNTTALIDVTPNDDSLVEVPETVNLSISKIVVTDPDITLGAPATGTVTINDNDFAIVTVTATKNGNEGIPTKNDPTHGEFTVSMSTPSSVNTVVSLTVTGTATAGSDYVSIPLSVTIPANFLSTTIPVTVIDDLINEAPVETVILSLGAVTAGHLSATAVGAPSKAQVDITDDEQPLIVSNVATKATATEGGPNGEFQFQLNYPSDNATVIEYKVNAGTATIAVDGLNPDYNASALTGSVGPTFLTGKVTINAGDTTVALPVVAFQDYVAEGPESVIVEITKITNNNPNSIGTALNTVMINDVVYTVSVVKTDSPAAEPGPPVGSNGQFTFNLTAPLPEPTIVKYTVGGTASAVIDPLSGKADYSALSGTVTIPANATQFKLDVDVIDDLLLEGDETVTITLTSAISTGPAYKFGAPTVGVDPTVATETINDNDAATISVAGTDGQESGQPAVTSDGKFVITQSAVSATNTVVTYTILGTSTASATVDPFSGKADYTAITGTQTATILAGKTTVAIPVDVIDDNLIEPSETVVLKLLTPLLSPTDPQVTIGTNTATVNIIDDDTAVASIFKLSNGFEPGTNDGQFAIILTSPSSTPTVVSYKIDGSGDATLGSDYVLRDASLNLLSGSITIPAGKTSVTLVVDVLDDNIIENAETVVVGLTGTDNKLITTSAPLATVTIDDFGSIDQDMGKVVLSKLVDGDENLGGAAINGKFLVTLVPTNPLFDTKNGPFSADEDTVVTYTITGGTALNPSDHTLINGSVTILKGQTTAIIEVPVVDDNVAEAPETLQLTLGAVTAGHTSAIVADGTPASIAMLDDDSSVLQIGNASVTEGNQIVFTVTSPTAVAGGFTVVFTVTDVTTGKFGGSDFSVVTGSPLVFSGKAGETQVIKINTSADNLVEADETFTVTLGTATPGLPLVTSGASATGTIANDDKATFKITDASVTEGSDGSPEDGPFSTMTFTLSLDNPIDQDTTVDVDFTDVTAIGGDFDPFLSVTPFKIPTVTIKGFDYDNDSSESKATVTQFKFVAGSTTSQLVTVAVTQDNIVEGGAGVPTGPNDPGVETFTAVPTVTTTGRNTVVDATVAGFKGIGTITDDDSATVQISSSLSDLKASEPLDTVNEGNGKFVLVQTLVSSTDTVIKYTISGTATPSGTSALEDDYTKLSGTVTILAVKRLPRWM